MALNPTYTQTDVLQKIDIGGSIYWLKDADLRAIVETFGDIVKKDVNTTFDENSVNISTDAATAAWVKEKISSLAGVMHFMGIVTRASEEQTDLEAIAAFYTAASKTPISGDVVIMSDNSKEYIYDGAKWEEIGDQNIYLTIAAAKSTYVPKTTTIAGIDLNDNITAEELSASTALNLKSLAHKDSATGKVNVIKSVDDLTVAKAGQYTVAGTTVAVPKTYNELDVTAAGNVTVNAGVAASATYDKTTSATISSSDVPENGTANYTPAGKVSLPAINAGVTLKSTDVATVADKGTEYKLSDGSVTKADDTKAKFVKKGVKFAVDNDSETLSLSYVANTDTEYDDFYTDAVTKAGDITYAPQTFTQGALPTFGTQTVALSTGATADASYNGDATFTGEGTIIAAKLGYTTSDASVVQPTFTADFVGTTKTVTPTVNSTADAQAPNATITITTEALPVKVNTQEVTVTVQ